MKYAITYLFALVLFLGCAPAPDYEDEFFPEPGNPIIECDDNGCCPKVADCTKRFFRRVV